MQNKLGLSPPGKSFSNPPTLCPTAERGRRGNGGKRCSTYYRSLLRLPFFPSQPTSCLFPLPLCYTHTCYYHPSREHTKLYREVQKNIISLKNNSISHTHKLQSQTISQFYLHFCCIFPCIRGKGGRGVSLPLHQLWLTSLSPPPFPYLGGESSQCIDNEQDEEEEGKGKGAFVHFCASCLLAAGTKAGGIALPQVSTRKRNTFGKKHALIWPHTISTFPLGEFKQTFMHYCSAFLRNPPLLLSPPVLSELITDTKKRGREA